MVPSPKLNGGKGRSAHSREGAEGGDQGDDGEGDSYSREGQIPVPRYVPDIDPVHDIVKYINELGRHRRYCHGNHQFPQRLTAQFLLRCLHKSVISFSLKFLFLL